MLKNGQIHMFEQEINVPLMVRESSGTTESYWGSTKPSHPLIWGRKLPLKPGYVLTHIGYPCCPFHKYVNKNLINNFHWPMLNFHVLNVSVKVSHHLLRCWSSNPAKSLWLQTPLVTQKMFTTGTIGRW